MSAPDPQDGESEQLFAALREERVPEGAELRALRAARAASNERAKHSAGRRLALFGGALASCAAAAAAIALGMRPAAPTVGIRAEPTSAVSATSLVRPTQHAAEAPFPSASNVPALPRAAAVPMPSHSAPVTLSDELGALKVASAELNAGDASTALSALDRYEHTLKGTQLRAEATLLRIQALSKAGRAGPASALAERFVTQNPDSPLVDRARSFIQEK